MTQIMAIIPSMVAVYSNAVYLQGIRRLTARDGYSGVPDAYRTPAIQYAAAHYTIEQLQQALANDWINQDEYDETVAYIV